MRAVVSLLLVVHLFCIFVAVSANYSPSSLLAQLVTVLRPYTQLLNFDLNYKPYHLTHATYDDVDHRIEVLPRGMDESIDGHWIVLHDAGRRGGDRYHRYQRLADTMAFFGDREDSVTPGLIAQAVGGNFLHQRDIPPAQIRCRKHLLQSREWLSSGTPTQRDPYHSSRYVTSYRANVLVGEDGQVDVVKIEEVGHVARPEGN